MATLNSDLQQIAQQMLGAAPAERRRLAMEFAKGNAEKYGMSTKALVTAAYNQMQTVQPALSPTPRPEPSQAPKPMPGGSGNKLEETPAYTPTIKPRGPMGG